jgi:hypothetical protein
MSNPSDAAREVMLRAVGQWLEIQGWTPLVISALRIDAQYGFNYELVLRVTGRPPEGFGGGPISRVADPTPPEDPLENFAPQVRLGQKSHKFSVVDGNRFCGVCGAGKHHLVHSVRLAKAQGETDAG